MDNNESKFVIYQYPRISQHQKIFQSEKNKSIPIKFQENDMNQNRKDFNFYK